jgi:hypothetical protein
MIDGYFPDPVAQREATDVRPAYWMVRSNMGQATELWLIQKADSTGVHIMASHCYERYAKEIIDALRAVS